MITIDKNFDMFLYTEKRAENLCTPNSLVKPEGNWIPFNKYLKLLTCNPIIILRTNNNKFKITQKSRKSNWSCRVVCKSLGTPAKITYFFDFWSANKKTPARQQTIKKFCKRQCTVTRLKKINYGMYNSSDTLPVIKLWNFINLLGLNWLLRQVKIWH